MSHRRWWYAVGVGTATWAGVVLLAASPYREALAGSTLGRAVGVAWLGAWLGIPVAIYLDIRAVRDDVAWEPTAWAWMVASLPWVVNVAAGATYVVRRASAVENNVPSRRWHTVVVGCWAFLGLVTLLDVAPTSGAIPDLAWDVLVGGWLVASGVLPAAVYLDAERVAGYTDWDPQRPLWVLGAGVPFLNLLGALFYLNRRREAVGEADAPNTLSISEPEGDGAAGEGAGPFGWAVVLFGVHFLAIVVLAVAVPSASEGSLAMVGLVTWPPFGVPFAVLMRRDMKATAERGVEWGLTRYLYLAAALVQGAAFWSLVARSVKVQDADDPRTSPETESSDSPSDAAGTGAGE